MPRSRAETTESPTRRASASLQEILCVSARDLRVLGENAEGPRAETQRISTKNAKVSRRHHKEPNKTSLCVFARDPLRLRERSPRARRARGRSSRRDAENFNKECQGLAPRPQRAQQNEPRRLCKRSSASPREISACSARDYQRDRRAAFSKISASIAGVSFRVLVFCRL